MGSGLTLGVSGWRLHGQRTGVGRYLLNLVEQWTPELVAGRFDRITIYSHQPFGKDDAPRLPGRVIHRVVGPAMPMIPWENLRLAPVARDSVMFYPSYSRPLMSRGATVVVTHDATMRLHPDMFTRRDRFVYGPLYGWSARAASLVITTTEAAKTDIAREWNVDPDRIGVTHLAAAECFRPLPATIDRAALRLRLTGADAPYFLFVGKVSGRRNLPRLVEAFAELRNGAAHTHRLVVAGPRTAVEAAEAAAVGLGIRSYLTTRTFVLDAELNDLYNCADAFVMPSTYETVSFPIMEAQAAGTPVICVDTPGSREMTGGAAVLIASLSIGELVGAMSAVAGDPALRSELSAQGLANAARFSWARCATATLDLCLAATRRHRAPT